MEKEKLITTFEELIEDLYKSEEITNNQFDEIENGLNEMLSYLGENKFYREILILVKTAKEANGERLNHLKIAIISDLEKEVIKLKLSSN